MIQANIVIEGDPPVATCPTRRRSRPSTTAAAEQIAQSIASRRPQAGRPVRDPGRRRRRADARVDPALLRADLQDHSIPPALQRRMIRRASVRARDRARRRPRAVLLGHGRAGLRPRRDRRLVNGPRSHRTRRRAGCDPRVPREGEESGAACSRARPGSERPFSGRMRPIRLRGAGGAFLSHRSVEAEASSFTRLSFFDPVFDDAAPTLAPLRRRALEVALLFAEPGEHAPNPGRSALRCSMSSVGSPQKARSSSRSTTLSGSTRAFQRRPPDRPAPAAWERVGLLVTIRGQAAEGVIRPRDVPLGRAGDPPFDGTPRPRGAP